MKCQSPVAKLFLLSVQLLSRMCNPGGTWSRKACAQQRGRDVG